jgi:putative DNA primase/helicase
MSAFTPAQARAPDTDIQPPDPDDLDEDEATVCGVVVTFFVHHSATTKREGRLDLAAIAERIHATSAPTKEQLPWLKLAKFGDTRTGKGSLRHNSNVIAITGLEGDYDLGEKSLADAKDVVASSGIAAIIYPSPSYTPERPKWRVLCPFSQEYPPTERDRFMARLNGLFGGIFSRESWVISQSYFFGRVANPDHHATVFEGIPIDLADHLDAGAIGCPKERGVGRQAHPTSRPEDITEARVRGIVNALLDNIRRAVDAEKHYTLRDNAISIGGYLHYTGWSVDEAVEQAVSALPSADDWDKARDTARWAISRGMEQPLELEDRPYHGPYGGGGGAPLPGGPDDEGAPPPGAPPGPEPLSDPAPPDDEPPPWSPPLPAITITPASFVTNAEQGERALIKARATVYRRLNKLVRPIDMQLDAAPETTIEGERVNRKTHAPGLISITQPILRQMLHQAATWMKYDARKRKLAPAAPSNEAAELVLHRVGFWPFPDVAGIIGTPVMRSDGSILSAPGYDPATGLILHNPPPMPDFNHTPTRTDAEWSCMRLKNDLLSGFPFVDDASRSVGLSGIITPIVRAAIKQTPMHGASAPLAGTGKSYLWDLVSYIANGAAMPVMAAGRDEAETEKRIVMLLLKALSMWSIDNVNGALEGDFLCQVITQPRIMPRKLGVSDGPDPDMLNTLSTYSTGNNIRFLGDMPRRVAVARMDANMERPELRTFETQPHKLILANRGLYIADCLTIPLAYMLAGSPGRLPPLAGFEEWSDVVRSALVWLDCTDPIETVATSDNPGQEQAAALLAAWPQGLTSYTTAELLEVAQQRDPATTDFLNPDLLAALQPIAKDRRGSLDTDTLGKWLRDHKDTVVGTLKLTRHGTKTRPSWGVTTTAKGQPL